MIDSLQKFTRVFSSTTTEVIRSNVNGVKTGAESEVNSALGSNSGDRSDGGSGRSGGSSTVLHAVSPSSDPDFHSVSQAQRSVIEEHPDHEPWLLRVSFPIRAVGATLVLAVGIALAAIYSPAFLILVIPAMMLVSERGEM